MMYWTDWGANPKIEKAEMDGSGRRSIVTGNLAWPNGLTLDQATNRLFWADAKLEIIEMSDLDGGNRQTVLPSTAGIHPYGLTIYQDIIYWTDWNSQSVTSYNATSGQMNIVIPDLQKPMDIHVFDPSLILSGKSIASFLSSRSKQSFIKAINYGQIYIKKSYLAAVQAIIGPLPFSFKCHLK